MSVCGIPIVQDIARIQGDGEVLSVSLGSETIRLATTDPHLSLRFEYLKSRIVRIAQEVRAAAMLRAASVAPDVIPPWLISTRVPIVEWIAWAGCLDDILKRVQTLRRTNPILLVSGRVGLDVHVGGRNMTLRGGIYRGVLSATIGLNVKPAYRFIDEPQPRINVEATELPETVVNALNAPRDPSNRGLRLGDVLGHPLFSPYDAPVTRVQNRKGAVEISLDASYSTLAPIPATALRAMPRDADPTRPLDLTRSERERLRALNYDSVAIMR